MVVAAVDIASFALTSMAQAVKSLYKVGSEINEFVNEHLAQLEASEDPTVASIGRVLLEAKAGFGIGYASSVIIIAAGQLLLGNPLSAVGTVATAAVGTNPVAMTCAAVGAIWYGWKALTDDERNSVLARLHEGFQLGIELIRSLIDFVIRTARETLGSKQVSAMKDYVASQAARFGKSLYAVTGAFTDLVLVTLPGANKLSSTELACDELNSVLKAMDTVVVVLYPENVLLKG